MLLLGTFVFSNEAYAASPTKALIETESLTLKSGETLEIPFTTTEKMIFTTEVDIVFKENPDIGNLWVESGGIKVKLFDANGNRLQNDYSDMTDWFEDDRFVAWWIAIITFRNWGHIPIILRTQRTWIGI